jgi:hypothetical protein
MGKAENEVTENYLSQIPFREAIAKRYENLFNYEKFSAPTREGNISTTIKFGSAKPIGDVPGAVDGGAANCF